MFRLKPSSTVGGKWTFVVLYTFQLTPDAASPDGTLVLGKSGELFGLTGSGGTGTNCFYGGRGQSTKSCPKIKTPSYLTYTQLSVGLPSQTYRCPPVVFVNKLPLAHEDDSGGTPAPTPHVAMLGTVVNREYPPLEASPRTYKPTGVVIVGEEEVNWS